MRSPVLLMLALLAGTTASAQSVMYTSATRVFHSTVGQRTVVRDQAGHLYAAYADLFVPTQSDVAIARSTDGGQTWNMKWQTGFAANAPTDWGNRAPSLAIDSQGNLHCSWYHAPDSSANNRSIRYNRWDARTQAWGTEWDRHRKRLQVQRARPGRGCTGPRLVHPQQDGNQLAVRCGTFQSALCLGHEVHPGLPGLLHPGHLPEREPHAGRAGPRARHLLHHPRTPPSTTASSTARSGAPRPGWETATARPTSIPVWSGTPRAMRTSCTGWTRRAGRPRTRRGSYASGTAPPSSGRRRVPVYKTTRAQYKPGGTDNNGRVITCRVRRDHRRALLRVPELRDRGVPAGPVARRGRDPHHLRPADEHRFPAGQQPQLLSWTHSFAARFSRRSTGPARAWTSCSPKATRPRPRRNTLSTTIGSRWDR